MDALIREVGILREGYITFHEFVAATLPRTVYFEASHITTVFRGLDVDGDGVISERDLQQLLGSHDEYPKAILVDCDADPLVGLQFMDFFRVYCSAEYNHY